MPVTGRWERFQPLDLPRRQFHRLTASQNRFNNVWRKEGEGENAADLTIVHTFFSSERGKGVG